MGDNVETVTVQRMEFGDPVSLCETYHVNHWVRGHVNKEKFRGRLLSRASEGRLEGDYEPMDIIKGNVKHGWLISCAGDTSGCGWDTSMYFLDEPLPEGTKQYEVWSYGEEGDVMAEIVDGPHEVTWWEAVDGDARY